MSGRAGAVVRPFAVLVAGAACYGFAAGMGHDLLYASRNLVKLPLLLLATAATGAAASWVVALTLELRLSFVATQRIAFALYRDVALLLASLSPIVLFLALVLRATDDGQRGGYDLFLGANMAAVALSGTLALLRQVRALREQGGLAPARARAVTLAWLAIALLVGGQASFWMRPFFGYPATRGVRPPWFLGAQPDLRGATNFFEAVAQAAGRVPLPADLDERIRQIRELGR